LSSPELSIFIYADKYNLNQLRPQQHMGLDNPFVSGKRAWNLGYKPMSYGLKVSK
jgi:deoxyribonuclease-1